MVEVCENLDYSKLEKEYVRVWRKVNPATMFMVLVYAYMRRLYSSRQIEEACRTDIRFMWILGAESAPDHSSIARFQNIKLGQYRAIPVCGLRSKIFRQVVQKGRRLAFASQGIFVQHDGNRFEQGVRRELCGVACLSICHRGFVLPTHSPACEDGRDFLHAYERRLHAQRSVEAGLQCTDRRGERVHRRRRAVSEPDRYNDADPVHGKNATRQRNHDTE